MMEMMQTLPALGPYSFIVVFILTKSLDRRHQLSRNGDVLGAEGSRRSAVES